MKIKVPNTWDECITPKQKKAFINMFKKLEKIHETSKMISFDDFLNKHKCGKNGQKTENKIKRMIRDKNGMAILRHIIRKSKLISLDEDILRLLDNSAQIKVISGNEKTIVGKIKNPSLIKRILIYAEIPKNKTITIDNKIINEIRPFIEKITDAINPNAKVIWCAELNKKIKKMKVNVLLGYKYKGDDNEKNKSRKSKNPQRKTA